MARLRYSPAARVNLIEILNYVREQTGDRSAGRRYVDRLRARCLELSRLPWTMGRSRNDLLPQMRSSAFGNHIIFFRYVEGVLEIVAVVEGHRDFDAYFKVDQ